MKVLLGVVYRKYSGLLPETMYLNNLLSDVNAACVICFRLKHVLILNGAIVAICVLMAIFLPKIGTIIR